MHTFTNTKYTVYLNIYLCAYIKWHYFFLTWSIFFPPVYSLYVMSFILGAVLSCKLDQIFYNIKKSLLKISPETSLQVKNYVVSSLLLNHVSCLIISCYSNELKWIYWSRKPQNTGSISRNLNEKRSAGSCASEEVRSTIFFFQNTLEWKTNTHSCGADRFASHWRFKQVSWFVPKFRR